MKNIFVYNAGKENRKEVKAQLPTKTAPIATKELQSPSAQILTRSRNANNKKDSTSAVAAKMSQSTRNTAISLANSSIKSSKVPATHKSGNTVMSILVPPSQQKSSSPTVNQKVEKPEPKKEEEKEKTPTASKDLVIPEQNSIGRKSRALSGSETAIAELDKKQGVIDERIQIHQGAIDRKALTSQSPALVIKDVARILHILGIDTTLESPYILRCCRRKTKSYIAAELLKKQNESKGKTQYDEEKEEEEEEEDDDFAIDASSANSSGISTSTTAVVVRGEDPIYGDASIDNGDEIRFVVEMCRFKNLPGLFIVDIRRLRGNAWAYKFLYHKLIDFLDLGKNNYM
jgi:hypothetical protein